MPILITYLLMDMKGVSLDNNYIVDFGILYFDWSMVWAFIYKRIECNKDESLFQFIDLLTNKPVHEITSMLKYKNILITFCLWYFYYRLIGNRLYIILLLTTIKP